MYPFRFSEIHTLFVCAIATNGLLYFELNDHDKQHLANLALSNVFKQYICYLDIDFLNVSQPNFAIDL